MKRLILSFLIAMSASGASGQALVNGVPPTTPEVEAVKGQVTALMTAQAQSVEATMDTSGNFTWSFPIAFTTKPRVAYFPQNSDVSGVPIVCNYQTLTPTSITFHCDKAAGSLVSLLNPLFNNRGASGAVVQVIARGTLVTPVMP
jgi:hypothetical protein